MIRIGMVVFSLHFMTMLPTDGVPSPYYTLTEEYLCSGKKKPSMLLPNSLDKRERGVKHNQHCMILLLLLT